MVSISSSRSLFGALLCTLLLPLMPYGNTGYEVTNWEQIKDNVQSAVVHIMCHTATKNPCEPYKKPHESGATGSGFFINPQGEIITNFHVIEHAQKIEITLPNISKKKFRARIVGCKPRRDVALLRLTKKARRELEEVLRKEPGFNGKIPYLELGDSNSLTPTETIMAIGFPLHDGVKYTIGQLSGYSDNSIGYYQVTTPINRGNSGGPSVDKYGKVVGINTAGLDPGKVNTVCYIIPINHVKAILKDLRKNTVIAHLPLTHYCEIQRTTETLLKAYNCEKEGVLISNLPAGGHAEQLGFRAGDIITSINGYQIESDGKVKDDWSKVSNRVMFRELFNHMKATEEYTLTIWRGNQEITLTHTLELRDTCAIKEVFTQFEEIPYRAFGGLVIQPLCLNHMALCTNGNQLTNPQLLAYLDDQNNHTKNTLIISHIHTNSLAREEAGLQAGSLIKKVNGKEVCTLAEFDAAITSSESEYIVIETDSGIGALAIIKMLEDEKDLEEIHKYNRSELVQHLFEKYKSQLRPEDESEVDDEEISDDEDDDEY